MLTYKLVCKFVWTPHRRSKRKQIADLRDVLIKAAIYGTNSAMLITYLCLLFFLLLGKLEYAQSANTHGVGDQCTGTDIEQDSGAPKCSNSVFQKRKKSYNKLLYLLFEHHRHATMPIDNYHFFFDHGMHQWIGPMLLYIICILHANLFS